MIAVSKFILLLLGMCWVAVPALADQTEAELNAAVQQEAQRGGYRLIGVEELWQLYQDESANLLLIDTRQDWEHRTGHIDGSIHLSMEPNWFSRLIQRSALAQALGEDKRQHLVFY